MAHMVSFAMFASVLVFSLAVIVATVRQELPLILDVLGLAPPPAPPLARDGERRVRVVRQARLVQKPQAIRAAA